jgi:predicted PolB exonuclease-like 3'-5' exonuclease
MIEYNISDIYPLSPIFFDIETAPLPKEQIKAVAPDFEAPKNYKSEEAIEKYKLERLADFIADGGLHAHTGKVIAIGFAIGDRLPVVNIDLENEKSLLETFWNLIVDEHGAMSHQVFGFNSNTFDIPFLVRRSWINDVEVPPTIFYRRGGRIYLNDMFKDVMLEWSCGTMEKVKLDVVAKSLGVGAKNGNGALFYKQVLEDYEQASEYLKNDVDLVRKCAIKMQMV